MAGAGAAGAWWIIVWADSMLFAQATAFSMFSTHPTSFRRTMPAMMYLCGQYLGETIGYRPIAVIKVPHACVHVCINVHTISPERLTAEARDLVNTYTRPHRLKDPCSVYAIHALFSPYLSGKYESSYSESCCKAFCASSRLSPSSTHRDFIVDAGTPGMSLASRICSNRLSVTATLLRAEGSLRASARVPSALSGAPGISPEHHEHTAPTLRLWQSPPPSWQTPW